MKIQFLTTLFSFSALLALLFSAGCGQNVQSAPLKVKVATLPTCGSTKPTVALVKEVAKELGVKMDFVYVPITTVELAQTHRHIGSPTIQINGQDIDPGARTVDKFGIA